MNITIIPFIVVCCYIVGEFYKQIFKKDTYKYIPILLAFIGGILGLVIYLITPEIIKTNNPFDAILIGIISGTSSTGYNQIIKKLLNKGENKNGN